MQATRVLVLGSEEIAQSPLERTLSGLGCTVSALGRPDADILMLDLRGRDDDWRELLGAIAGDDRPAMIVCERPCSMLRELVRRRTATVLITGRESQAGYRLALTVLRALGGRTRRDAPPCTVPGTRDEARQGARRVVGTTG